MWVNKWASIDDRSPFGDFWFEPVTKHSSTGLRVGAEQAMKLAAVYACVKLLAKCFAVMPFGLWRPQDDGGRAAVTNHWAYRLFGLRPNRWQNPFEFRQMVMGHLALRGNSFCLIEETGGAITELIPKHPDRMKAETLPNGDYRYVYHEADGSETRYNRGEIWHLRDLSSNGIMGLSPIEAQRDVMGLGLAAQEFGARFFANDGTPSGWISHPGRFADKEKKDFFRESWQKAQSDRNRGKTAVLEDGMEYHAISVSNTDAQYLESRRFTTSEIARMFGVPPHLIGDLDRATFSNIEQQSLEFVIYTMAPIARAWAESIKYQLLNEQDQELAPDFDVQQLLRGDQVSRAQFYTKMFGVGAYSTNDIRKKEGDNPVPGGDMRFRPVNLSPLDPKDAAAFAAAGLVPGRSSPAPGDGGDDGRDPDDEQQETNGRGHALAEAAAARITRKEIQALARCRTNTQIFEFYGSHAPFVAEALGISQERARVYCRDQMHCLAASPGTFEQDTRARLVALALEPSP